MDSEWCAVEVFRAPANRLTIGGGLAVNISPRATGGLASESNERTRLFPMAASQLSTAQQLESIWKLGGLTPKQLAREVIHRVYEDNLLGRASELAYSFVLAVFPGMLLLLSLLGFFASHAVTLIDANLAVRALRLVENDSGASRPLSDRKVLAIGGAVVIVSRCASMKSFVTRGMF
jgi:hypothetical protein